jgi:CheY-like chemotaxis protein
LVVDDDPVIRDMMVDILDFEGYPIRVARNGNEALELMRSGENFLVFLDLLMPVMSGKDVCDILDKDPTLRNRHVIILMSALDRLEESSTLNVDGIMPKPFIVDDVVKAIEPYMG